MKKIEQARQLFKSQRRGTMKIFLLTDDPPTFYKSIPWTTDLQVNVGSSQAAERLIHFLS